MMFLLTSLIMAMIIIVLLSKIERLREELVKSEQRANKLEKKSARKKGREDARKLIAKERFYDKHRGFIKAKERIHKSPESDKVREDYLYLGIVIQILDKYSEVIKDETLSYQDKDEIIAETIVEIMKNHYHSDWDELE